MGTASILIIIIILLNLSINILSRRLTARMNGKK
jgi:ABC-type phosphate transport system permease subunit